MNQSPAFVAAVHTYRAAYRGGIRDTDRLSPLVAQIDAAFCWQPSPPAAPLTPAERDSTIATWQALDAAHDGKITELADVLLELSEDERARTIDLWIAVMDVMQAA